LTDDRGFFCLVSGVFPTRQVARLICEIPGDDLVEAKPNAERWQIPRLNSNLGNASSHGTINPLVLLAGGGFRHGQHLVNRLRDFRILTPSLRL
jgi:hypothetical protein